MKFRSADLAQSRVWLRDVVQPTLDDLIAHPVDMHRAYAALMMVTQYHERLFYDLARHPEKLAMGTDLERFRSDLASASQYFDSLRTAADPETGHSLKFTNILSARALLNILTGQNKVYRAIILATLNRQLIPLLEDLMAAYRRLLDRYEL